MPKVFDQWIYLLIFSIFWIGCSEQKDNKAIELPSHKTEKYIVPFSAEEGQLTVLMDNSLTSYFIFQGQALGYEYEMLKLFAEENELNLNIKIIHQADHILDSLLVGAGHMVAANLSISEERMQLFDFSEPLFRT